MRVVSWSQDMNQIHRVTENESAMVCYPMLALVDRLVTGLFEDG